MTPLAPDAPHADGTDVSRVFRAAAEYAAELEAGRRPDRAAYLAKYADVAALLAECLSGMDAVRGAALVPTDSLPSLRDYQIVGEVGRGGMGVVYEAMQTSLGRKVAVKLLSAADATDARRVQRFRTEAAAAAQLRHPHIVPVHAVGCEGDTHFLSMDLIDGRPLTEWLADRRGPSPPSGDRHRDAARIVSQASGALHHAHQVGVVHRDVKPANLLIESSGHVWVTDFGLARFRGADPQTRTGELVGTLRYISPEQVAGGEADARSDVYALGVTLYELSTLQPAFPGTDTADVLRRIASADPPTPRSIDPTIPRDLETVILKAAAKEPADRYATAGELAADLDRFLTDHPLAARRPTTLERGRKWAKRHRGLVRGAGAAAFAVLILAVAGVSLSASRIADEKRNADKLNTKLTETVDQLAEEKKTAEKLNTDLGVSVRARDTALAQVVVQLARRDWQTGDLDRATLRLSTCPPETRRWEWHYLDRLCREVGIQKHLGQHVSALGVSPDGTRIVVCARPVGAMKGESVLRCFDSKTGADLWSVGLGTKWAGAVVFGPAGDWVATADATIPASVTTRDAATGRVRESLAIGNGRALVGCGPDGRCVAVAINTSGVELWDVEKREKRSAFPLAAATGAVAALSPDATRIALTAEGRVTVRDLSTGQVAWSWEHPPRRPPLALKFRPDGRDLAALSSSVVRVWDLSTGGEVGVLGMAEGTTSFAFSPDGLRVAACGRDKLVRVWQLAGGVELATYRGHAEKATTVAFFPDGTRMATAANDHTVRVWDALAPTEGRRPLGFPRSHFGGSVDPREGRVAYQVPGAKAGVFLADAVTGASTPVADGLVGGRLAFTPNGAHLLGLGRDNHIRVWDAAARTPTAKWPTALRSGNALTVSADGRYVAAGDLNKVQVFEFPSGRELRTFEVGTLPLLRALAFGPGGQLAIGQEGGTLEVWDVATGLRVRELRGHPKPVGVAAFSPDGKIIVSCCWDGMFRWWDAATGSLRYTVPGPDRGGLALAFNPDGTRLASAWGDAQVRVWDTATGEECITLAAGAMVSDVRFSADGRTLTALTLNGPIRWSAVPR